MARMGAAADEIGGAVEKEPMEAGDRDIEGGFKVKVEPFDYSVDNFLAAVRSISALCGEPSEETFQQTELHRFSSMVLFMKEWRDFYYKPKVINFAYETGSGEVKDAAMNNISLPQFSSAMVPRMEESSDGTRFATSNDFVLYSGGPVWALDWCPRIHERSKNDIKCEYLAVAAHPSDSSYHNIGAPLVGRGLIQIWCLVSNDDKEALSLSRPSAKGRPKKIKAELPDGLSIVKRPRGRPRKRILANDASNVKRPRGRPRKVPKNSLDDVCQKEISTGRPRGRPRKRKRGKPRKQTLSPTVVNGIEESPKSNNDPTPSPNERISPQSIEFGSITPISANLNEEESCVPRCRGRPKKKPFPSVNKSIESSVEALQNNNDPTLLSLSECIPPLSSEFGEVGTVSADLNEKESIAARPRGRPRKKPTPGLTRTVQSGVRSLHFDNDHTLSPNECVSPVSIEFKEVALESSDLKEESVAPRHRGRPRKSLIPNAGKFVQISAVESPEMNHCLTVCQSKCVSPVIIQSRQFIPASANLSKEESVVPRRRGRPSKKLIPSVINDVQVSAIESPQTNNDLTLGPRECVSTSSIEPREAIPVSTNLIEVESVVQRCVASPKKKPIQSSTENIQISGTESLQTNSDPTLSLSECVSPLHIMTGGLAQVSSKSSEKELVVPRCRGRPRKKPIPSVNNIVQISGIESPPSFSDVSLNEWLSPTSIEVGEVTPASANLKQEKLASANLKHEKLTVPRCSGRPRKMPILTVNKSLPAFSVESEEVNLELPISTLLGKKKLFFPRGRGRLRKNLGSAVSLTGQADEEFEMAKCEVVGNGQPPVGSDLIQSVLKRSIEEKARVVTGAITSNPTSSIVSERESSATVVPTQDDHCRDAKFVSKEVNEQSSLEHMSNSLIPEEFALPRVVLCLAHNGRVAWDVKWKPSDFSDSEGKHHMGYLAVLLGNGSLEVWEVPLPSMVMSLYASSDSEGTDPRFVKLEPVFRCSKLKCGERQSIPLTIEWSSSASQDLILGGCHDGTVALWKFTPQFSSQDTKPLLCFAADTLPIRAVAWAPEASDAECANLVTTAGHEGLKFWDLRDPYHPLWHINPQGAILSVDWFKDPGCVILSLDDGTVRTLSIWRLACFAPFAGEPISGGKKLGLTCMCSLPFAIWSVHVSRATGLAAYCSADGSAIQFQVTASSVDRPRKQNKVPHVLCGSIKEEGQILKIRTLLDSASLADDELEGTSKSIFSDSLPKNEAQESNLLVADDCTLVSESTDSHALTESKSSNIAKEKPGVSLVREVKVDPVQISGYGHEGKPPVEEFPPKIVAMHRVRWNPNKGSERWLCYGGAAGIIRCQKVAPTSV